MSESKRIIVVDTETTGLDPERDELLQVSIIDNNGKKLFDSLFKPKAASWEAAMRVNHITPEMVQDAPRIAEKIAEITEIMCQADEIIGYNTKFDIDFLENNGLVLRGTEKIIDVMAMFKETHEIKKWVKLTEAAAFYDFEWGKAQAHNSLGDCRATLFVYDHLTCDDTSELSKREAVNLLWEMHSNCLDGDIYEDPIRYRKACALYKAIRALEKSDLDLLPPVQPKPKTGHWIKITPSGIYMCSECEHNVLTGDIDAYHYCHHCGIKMIEPQESEG